MPLTDIEKRELRRFRDRVTNELGDRRIVFRLFGSKARGDDVTESDLDVLVITRENDWRVRNRIAAAATQSLLATGLVISAKTLSRKQFLEMKKAGYPFIRNVEREGKPL